MSARTSVRLAMLLGALAVAATIAGFVLVLIIHAESPQSLDSLSTEISTQVAAIAFAVVGASIAIKRPGNMIGWALLCGGLSLAASSLGGSYARLALLVYPDQGLPAGMLALVLTVGLWTGMMASIFFLVVLFPTGRLPSPRWRYLARFEAVGFLVIYLLFVFWPGEIDPPFEQFEHPMAISALEPLTGALEIVVPVLLLGILVAVVNLLIRFLHSRGDEREQFRWLIGAVALLVIPNLLPNGETGIEIGGVDVMSIVPAPAIVPIAVGIAVFKYHLYEIDRILNRTLVYGLLTAILALTYLGLVVGLQEILSSFSGGSDLAVALTTLIVAALFLPARGRVQRVVDRRFNRRAYDAARTIDNFSARLREAIDLDTLQDELLQVIDETMQPAGASVWLRPQSGHASYESLRTSGGPVR